MKDGHHVIEGLNPSPCMITLTTIRSTFQCRRGLPPRKLPLSLRGQEAPQEILEVSRLLPKVPGVPRLRGHPRRREAGPEGRVLFQWQQNNFRRRRPRKRRNQDTCQDCLQTLALLEALPRRIHRAPVPDAARPVICSTLLMMAPFSSKHICLQLCWC